MFRFSSFFNLFSSSPTLSSPLIPPSDTSTLTLIFIHDSSNRGMYHVSPTLEHLAHALGCCTVDNSDDAYLTAIAVLSGSTVTPLVTLTTIKLDTIPSFIEAQRVLSQAQESEANATSHASF